MQIGTFSISLAVKDLEASRQFYEKFGFQAFAGNAAQHWLILKNGEHTIGLFQGAFDKNILTFNPGWDNNAQKLASFTDVRELQRKLKAQGVKLVTEADETTTGPASFMAVAPDGNQILVDQHVEPVDASPGGSRQPLRNRETALDLLLVVKQRRGHANLPAAHRHIDMRRPECRAPLLRRPLHIKGHDRRSVSRRSEHPVPLPH